MKKVLVLGSLAFALLIVGCGPKASTIGSGSVSYEGKEGMPKGSAGRDNFAHLSVAERIQYVDGNAKNIFFDFDKFIIRYDMQPAIDVNAKLFNAEGIKELAIRVEGNTDEWGTDEYNYALGLKRAVAVRDALAAKGVSKSQMILVSYGESKPTCTQKTKECWAENRKVTFKLLP